MENIKHQSRRKFFSASLSAAVIAGAGITFLITLLTSENVGANVQATFRPTPAGANRHAWTGITGDQQAGINQGLK